MITRSASVCTALVLFACGAADTRHGADLRALEDRLDDLEDRQHDQEQQTDALAARVAALTTDLHAIVRELQLAEVDYEAAARTFREAQVEADRASDDYADASRQYESAAQSYRAVVAVLAIAAAWDSMQTVCAGSMTTQQYREQLRSQGVDLEGVDIDHVWPHARGGADHPWNYQMLPSSLNRSLGASVWDKLMAVPMPVIQGLVTSAMARFGGC